MPCSLPGTYFPLLLRRSADSHVSPSPRVSSNIIYCEQKDYLALCADRLASVSAEAPSSPRAHLILFPWRLGFSSLGSARCHAGFQGSDWFPFFGKKPSVLHSFCPTATGRNLILSSIMLRFGIKEHFPIMYELKRNPERIKIWKFNSFHSIICILNYGLVSTLKF